METGRLPLTLTRLVGRERELEEVDRSVAANRLVTLTGVGGTGKTRLAAELARRIDVQRSGSVVWVELAAVTDPAIVAQQVAAALSVREVAHRGMLGTLADVLRERELLLVLDDCEHLLEACATLAGTLLSHCPRLKIVATSREPLGVAGEQVWPVPPLAIATEAVELFVDRAAAVHPSFALTSSNSAAVTEVCRRLDGIPLAIELAAARVRVLTPEQIAARLEDRFAILTGGARSTIPRHRTLRAAIDWSFALLNEREQKLLARLSVFSGSFSLEAVEAVCTDAAIEAFDMLDLLGGLVDKSLVVSLGDEGVTRYRLLETIREYAAGRLEDAGESRRRHAQAFLAIARDSVAEVTDGSVARLNRLDPDHDNMRAALQWSLEHEPETLALPLAAAFRWYWYYRILWREGLRWMTRVLERTSAGSSVDRAATLAGAGTFASYLGDLESGRPALEEAERLFRAAGDSRQLALTQAVLAHLLTTAGELDAAATRADEALQLARAVGTQYDVGYCLVNAASFVAQARGELELADRYLEEAEMMWTPVRHPLGLPLSRNARALLAIRRRDYPAAARFARAALAETRGRRDLWFTSRSLRILAFTTTRDPLRAARLLGAADGMLRAMTAGMLPHERAEYDRLLASLRESLSPEAMEAALGEGSRMTFDEACAFALSDDTTAETAPLHIHDLGRLHVTLGGKPLEADGRAASRALELLAFLAVHPDGRTREEVGVAFWPDASSEQVKNSFHVALHRLRKLLGRPDAVRNDGGRYRIAPDFAHLVDSRRFEAETTAALRTKLLGPLEAALSLYKGDYLEGEESGEWSHPIRTRLRLLYLRGLSTLGQGLEAEGRYTDAAESYAAIVAREPFDEAAWRRLMICRARLGFASESLLLYRELEQRLRDDLAAVPEAETRNLYRRLQQNESV